MKMIFICALSLIIGGSIQCYRENQKSFRIMTFNIRYLTAKDSLNSWDYRKSILLNCLKKYKPDILATQESLDPQINYILADFPDWKVFGVGRYHGVPEPTRPHESMKGESCRIFYNATKFELLDEGTYWHSDTPEIPGSITWGNTLPRITTWGVLRIINNNQQFVIMNTHFHWDEPYVSNTAKLIMRKWREIAGDKPAILLGDFNLDPKSETHELFCGRAGDENLRGSFKDCWETLSKSETEAGTGHGFLGVRSRKRIDWILTTEDWGVKGIETVYYNEDGKYPSDHYPVLSEIVLLN